MTTRKLPQPGDTFRRTVTVERDRLATRAQGDDRIPIALSSEQPVDRWYGREILVHTREAINLEYAVDGALPFCDNHDTDRQIGLVEDITLGDDQKLRGLLRKGNHPDAEWLFKDIESGIRKNVSIGYRINELKLEESDAGGDTYKATRWTPMECSTVPIPADITVGVGRSADEGTKNGSPIPLRFEIEVVEKAKQEEPVKRAVQDSPQDPTPAPQAKERTMPDEVKPDGAEPAHKPGPAAITLDEQRKSISAIYTLTVESGFGMDVASDMVGRGLSLDQAKAELFDRKKATAPKPIDVPGYLDISPKEARKYDMGKAILALVDRNWGSYEGIEREASDQIAKRLNRATGNILVPMDLQVRASVTGQTAGTSSLGGAGVQTSILSLIDLLRNKMLVRSLGATVLSGLTGNISFPRQITANTLNWTGENPSSANTLGNATFDNVTMSPKTAMVSTAYSRQFLIQSSFDASSFVLDDMAKVAALGLDLAALDGTGSSSQPTGIMRQTGVTAITHTGSNGGIPTWAELVGYETQVANNNADIGTLAWVTTPGMRGKLKTVLKSTTAGSTYLWESDNTINGYRAEVTNQIPANYTFGTSTTVAHGIVFGVWSELLLGEWGGALEVIVDPFTLAGQNMVAVTQALMVDVAVKHPKSFAITKSALIA